MYIKPNIITNEAITEWTNAMARAGNQSQFVHSDDFHITKNAAGTQLRLKRRHKLGYEDPYKKEFDPDVHYGKGDVIRVLTGIIYTDFQGNVVNASPGTWKCVANVPDNKWTIAFKNSGMDSGFYLRYLRQDGVEYFPKSPEPSTIADFSTNPTGCYWHLIGSLPCGS